MSRDFSKGFVLITDCLEGQGDLPDFGGECHIELRTAEDLEFQGETVEEALKEAVLRASGAGHDENNIYIFPLGSPKQPKLSKVIVQKEVAHYQVKILD